MMLGCNRSARARKRGFNRSTKPLLVAASGLLVLAAIVEGGIARTDNFIVLVASEESERVPTQVAREIAARALFRFRQAYGQ